MRLRELHVQQSRDAQTHDDHGFARRDFGQPLGVQAGGHGLDERRHRKIDLLRQHVDVLRRHRLQLGEAAIDVAAEQSAVRAKVRLTRAANVAGAAAVGRIDDDRRAGFDAGAGLGDLAHRLVAHDARVGDGNAALKDLQVGAADAGIGHANQGLAGVALRRLHVLGRNLMGRRQNHALHWHIPIGLLAAAPTTRVPWH